MSAPMSNIGGHHTLIYDVIKTNSSHGLHPTAGVFTAPESGIYVSTWTIRVFNNSYHGTDELEVNGQQVGALIAHSGVSDNDTGSTSVVVHVNKGEDVFLRTNMISNNGGIHSDSNGYNSFSGWKPM
ncbi:complement C1q-like protein 4 [Crassostrea virginica]